MRNLEIIIEVRQGETDIWRTTLQEPLGEAEKQFLEALLLRFKKRSRFFKKDLQNAIAAQPGTGDKEGGRNSD